MPCQLGGLLHPLFLLGKLFTPVSFYLPQFHIHNYICLLIHDKILLSFSSFTVFFAMIFFFFLGLSTPPPLNPNSVGYSSEDMFPFVPHLAGIPFEDGSLGFKDILEHVP